jgi:general secretion pathway protein E/type IV pilus assembly protein PilB
LEESEYIELDTNLQQLLTSEQAWHYRIVPKKTNDTGIEFYIESGADVDTLIEELEILFGKTVRLHETPEDKIHKTLGRYYRKGGSKAAKAQSTIDPKNFEDLLPQLITEAKNLGSSDIHFEIYEEKARVRFRIDGLLVERYSIDKDEYAGLINKIKIKSNLDIAEKRLPQDGRIFFDTGESKFDIRCSVLPTLYGEKVVLRILGNDAGNIDINELGMSEFDLHNYLEGTKKPNGIILISGPTGSGKTTTLYATLKLLNKETTNIVTIEDPIEYTLPGINQVQLKESIGLGFETALKSFLRQDPDIIMLGEIREKNTAQMAIRAALTGHLVLSTIHTNSAWATIARLTDMGIPPLIISSTLNLSVAQRLIRLLCPVCKRLEKFDTALMPRSYKAHAEVSEHYVHVGCADCYYTGYFGRCAIYEVVPIDAEVGELIKEGNTDPAKLLKEKGITTLSHQAFEVFRYGDTSLEEIYSFLLNTEY